MKSSRRFTKILVASALAAMCLAPLAAADNFTRVEPSPVPVAPAVSAPVENSAAAFGGTLRLFIVEPNSRWSDHNGQQFHYAFMDLALDSAVTIADGSRTILSRTWLASSSGFSGYNRDNIMVMAVLFEDDVHNGYSDPPLGGLFNAYYVAATAAARPGACDSNNTSGNSTHTAFLEEASANYCPYCPTTSYWVNSVFNSGNYNFFYLTHVRDRNSESYSVLNRYNVVAIPCTYFDGGDEVVLGGYSGTSPYTTPLLTSCQRAVEGANLAVKVEWLNANGDLAIDVILTKGAAIDNAPTVENPVGQVKPIIGQPYNYTTSGTDADGDDMYYKFNWGDGQESEWLGPYAPGETCTASRTWPTMGSYNVIVKSRDEWYAETAWSAPLAVQAGCCTLRGDVTGDNKVIVSDLTYLVNFLFKAGPASPCVDHPDLNNDNKVIVSDLTYLVNFLFKGGTAPIVCD